MKKKFIAMATSLTIALGAFCIPTQVNAANPLTKAGKSIQRSTSSIKKNSKNYYSGYIKDGIKSSVTNKKPDLKGSTKSAAKYSKSLIKDFKKIGNTLNKTIQSTSFKM